MSALEVRPAVESDLPGIVALYNHYVLHTAITFDLEPVTVEQRRGWFSHYADRGRHRLLVAVEEGEVRGYASSSQHRQKAAYDPSVETTVYVAHGHAGRRIGTTLYRALFAALQGEDVHRALAGIALPNEASIALHERFGFARVGVFTEQGRKLGRYWDVAWYEKPL